MFKREFIFLACIIAALIAMYMTIVMANPEKHKIVFTTNPPTGIVNLEGRECFFWDLKDGTQLKTCIKR